MPPRPGFFLINTRTSENKLDFVWVLQVLDKQELNLSLRGLEYNPLNVFRCNDLQSQSLFPEMWTEGGDPKLTPKKEACLLSLPPTALFSCPRGRARHCFGLVSKSTTSQRCPPGQDFRSWAPDGGAQGWPDLKINPPLGILQHKLTSLIKQTENKFGQVLGSWT